VKLFKQSVSMITQEFHHFLDWIDLLNVGWRFITRPDEITLHSPFVDCINASVMGYGANQGWPSDSSIERRPYGDRWKHNGHHASQCSKNTTDNVII